MRAARHGIQTAIVHHSIAMEPLQVIAQLLHFYPRIKVSWKIRLIARYVVCPTRACGAQAITWANIGTNLFGHMTSLGHNKFKVLAWLSVLRLKWWGQVLDWANAHFFYPISS